MTKAATDIDFSRKVAKNIKNKTTKLTDWSCWNDKSSTEEVNTISSTNSELIKKKWFAFIKYTWSSWSAPWIIKWFLDFFFLRHSSLG